MGFSSILDISSFFIGMIINLIFVALMCYYFKRKYDYLYEAQCEQSKIIYQLLHKQSPTPPSTYAATTMDFSCDPLVKLNGSVCDSDSESDSESECDEMVEMNTPLDGSLKVELETEDLDDLKIIDLKMDMDEPFDNTLHLTVEEVPTENLEITVNVVDSENETNYSKMSMKQLKDVLSSKGIKPKNNIKKDELIELITKDQS